jgi:predicted nucleic acid-binding protein
LERIGAQELLPRLYGEVHVPDAVWHEVFSLRTDRTPAWLVRHPPAASATAPSWSERLDRGETEAILLARELRADLLLIDESVGRKVARRVGLRVTGVVGVLLEAKRRGEVSFIAPLLHRLREAGFWLAHDLAAQALREAGESTE